MYNIGPFVLYSIYIFVISINKYYYYFIINTYKKPIDIVVWTDGHYSAVSTDH